MGKVGQIAIHPLEGTPEGLRLVEYGNWAGRGVLAPRASWAALMGRMELALGGIYFLKRPASANQGGKLLVGMALELKSALEAVAADPSLADISEVMVFVRRWGWEEAKELAYLAQLLTELASSFPQVVLHGAGQGRVSVAEHVKESLDVDWGLTRKLLQHCGFNWENMAVAAEAGPKTEDPPPMGGEEASGKPIVPETKPVARPRGRPAKAAQKEASSEDPGREALRIRALAVLEKLKLLEQEQLNLAAPAPVIGKYHLEKRGIVATMDIIDGRFVVRKGSQAARKSSPSMESGYKKLRQMLVGEGVLVEVSEEHYVFAQDYAFASASTAASVVRGAQTAGPRAWYDDDNVSLRGIKNDHHSLHETHRKPKGEILDEVGDADISASFKFVEEEDAVEETVESQPPTPKTERPAVPVMLLNERLSVSPEEESTAAEAVLAAVESPAPEAAPSAPIGAYRIIGKQVNATMDVVPGGFLVRRGSFALQKTSDTIAKHYLVLRSEMIANGVLVEQGEMFYEFAKDHLFSSISAASSIVLGRQTDGWISWRDKDGNFCTPEG